MGDFDCTPCWPLTDNEPGMDSTVTFYSKIIPWVAVRWPSLSCYIIAIFHCILSTERWRHDDCNYPAAKQTKRANGCCPPGRGNSKTLCSLFPLRFILSLSLSLLTPFTNYFKAIENEIYLHAFERRKGVCVHINASISVGVFVSAYASWVW